MKKASQPRCRPRMWGLAKDQMRMLPSLSSSVMVTDSSSALT